MNLKNGGYEKYLHFSEWVRFFSCSKSLQKKVLLQHEIQLNDWADSFEKSSAFKKTDEPLSFIDGILEELDSPRANLSFLILSYLLFQNYLNYFPLTYKVHFPILETPPLPSLQCSFHPSLQKILLQIYQVIGSKFRGSFLEVHVFLLLLDWIHQIEQRSGKYSLRTTEISSSLIRNIYTPKYLATNDFNTNASYDHYLSLIMKTSLESTKKFALSCAKEKEIVEQLTQEQIKKDTLAQKTSSLSSLQKNERPSTPAFFPMELDFDRLDDQMTEETLEIVRPYRLSYVNSNGELTRQEIFYLPCYQPKKL